MDRLAVAVALGATAVCTVAPQSIAREVTHVVILTAMAGVAVLFAAFIYQARRHQQLTKGIARLSHPATLVGQPVEIVPGLAAPLVAGLWRPRIFCGDDLRARLDDDELRAVVLHEQHHQRDHAPLRLLFLSSLAPAVTRTMAGRGWLERERARVEIEADAYALARGTSRPILASALSKLSSVPGLATAPGFSTAADLRIRALLGEPTARETDHRLSRLTGLAVLVAVSCLLVYLT